MPGNYELNNFMPKLEDMADQEESISPEDFGKKLKIEKYKMQSMEIMDNIPSVDEFISDLKENNPELYKKIIDIFESQQEWYQEWWPTPPPFEPLDMWLEWKIKPLYELKDPWEFFKGKELLSINSKWEKVKYHIGWNIPLDDNTKFVWYGIYMNVDVTFE